MARTSCQGWREGTAVFDSAIAVLQGLFPPNPNNVIELANGMKAVTPLWGYQYILVEMPLSSIDCVLKPWTECPGELHPLGVFEQHIKSVYVSHGFKEVAGSAGHFFGAIHNYVFGRPMTFENAVHILLFRRCSC
ncbi:hypothetical protein DFH29DRAFT_813862 [Suillus ampliporus]|nr:hypothetical protein DFH29DRAFT_813862 [Suillus ampliporus]